MNNAAPRLTRVQWLICVIAAIGFAFDTYELLMLPLIIRPALEQLGGLQFGTPGFAHWRDLMFYVPAVCGGIFGLLGGYLTDRLGRRHILTWSILLYAFSALGAGFATSLPMLLVLRTTTFVGVCVEFVAAVAWLAELFTEPRRREQIIGWTQAFSSLGGFMVSLVALLIAKIATSLPAMTITFFSTANGDQHKLTSAPPGPGYLSSAICGRSSLACRIATVRLVVLLPRTSRCDSVVYASGN